MHINMHITESIITWYSVEKHKEKERIHNNYIFIAHQDKHLLHTYIGQANLKNPPKINYHGKN